MYETCNMKFVHEILNNSQNFKIQEFAYFLIIVFLNVLFSFKSIETLLQSYQNILP